VSEEGLSLGLYMAASHYASHKVERQSKLSWDSFKDPKPIHEGTTLVASCNLNISHRPHLLIPLHYREGHYQRAHFNGSVEPE
jgi:hypothetical protein